MSTPKPVQGNSDFTTFNIRHGFAEALVRGMRSSFLSDQDYNHLIQCETLEDVRLNLTETDYADSIADFNSLTPAMLQKAAVEKVCFLFFLFLMKRDDDRIAEMRDWDFEFSFFRGIRSRSILLLWDKSSVEAK
jgi:hypothetical protein